MSIITTDNPGGFNISYPLVTVVFAILCGAGILIAPLTGFSGSDLAILTGVAAGLQFHGLMLAGPFIPLDALHWGASLLFLLIIGPTVEEALGHMRFLVMLVLAAILSPLPHLMTDFAGYPVIGPTGMVAAIAGAALVRNPSARIWPGSEAPARGARGGLPLVVLVALWVVCQMSVAAIHGPPGFAICLQLSGLVLGAGFMALFHMPNIRLGGGVGRASRAGGTVKVDKAAPANEDMSGLDREDETPAHVRGNLRPRS